MSARVRAGLSYCRVDGHPIFLDLPGDRYFEPPAALGDALIAFVEGNEHAISKEDFGNLLRLNLLTAPSLATCAELQPVVEEPFHSALESAAPTATTGLRLILEVVGTVLVTQLLLKRRRIGDVLESLIQRRQRMLQLPLSNFSSGLAVDAALEFNNARPYAPVDTRCLPDSLALTLFLLRRRVHTHIVFGVTRDPFGAHCWVQAGNVVLNDTIGNVNNHEPILVV